MIICLLSLLIPSYAVAMENNKTTLDKTNRGQLVKEYSKKEIKDLDQLLKMATKGETELPSDKKFLEQITYDSNLTNDFNVETYVTTQKLQEKQYENLTESSYATTVITLIGDKQDTITNDKIDMDAVSSGSGSKGGGDYGGAYGVYQFVTVYYDYIAFTEKNTDIYFGKLKEIRATWEIKDSSFDLISGYVRGLAYGHKVINPYSNWSQGVLFRATGYDSSQYRFYMPIAENKNYNFTPNWDYLYLSLSDSFIGGKADATIKRGSQTYNINSTPIKITSKDIDDRYNK